MVQKGLTKKPLSVPTSASSPLTQGHKASLGRGGRDMGVLFYLHNSRESIVLASSKLKTYDVGVQPPK